MDMLVGWIVEQIGYAGLYGGAGLLIGWNLLAQPAFVKSTYDKVVAYVKSKF
jgi:hypothetical protein